MSKEISVETLCDKYGEEQYVVRLCFDKQDSNQLFFVEMDERYTECCVFKSNMMQIPYCSVFQPIQHLDNDLFECLKCAKYFIVCACQNVNKFPPKTMNLKCTTCNFNCLHFTILCDSGRTINQQLISHYQCPCRYEFECDTNLGIKIN